jgi:hypothetical protein
LEHEQAVDLPTVSLIKEREREVDPPPVAQQRGGGREGKTGLERESERERESLLGTMLHDI